MMLRALVPLFLEYLQFPRLSICVTDHLWTTEELLNAKNDLV
jgi:hypothetical protein